MTSIEFKRYLFILWRWGWFIVLATALAAFFSYRAVSQLAPSYRATTTLLVGQSLKYDDPRAGDFSTSQILAQSYAQMVPRRPILQATVEALGLPMRWERLAASVNASAAPNSSLIQISVVDTDPQLARMIAGEVGHQLILQSPAGEDEDSQKRREFASQQVALLQTRIEKSQKQIEDLQDQLADETSALRVADIQSQIKVLEDRVTTWQGAYTKLLDYSRGSRTNYLSVLDPATLPVSPMGSNSLMNVLLAGGVAFLLATGAVLLIEYLDDTLRMAEDVSRTLAVPMVGSVARIHKIKNPTDSLINLREPDSPISEEYRLLRTNIQFACAEAAPSTLLVTSSGRGEGKSVTAANLAISFAQMGRQTVLVEADLRHPSICALFGISSGAGLASLFTAESAQRPAQQSQGQTGSLGTGMTVDDAEAIRRIESHLVPTPLPGLHVLPGGPIRANPGDILASPKMEQLLAVLRGMADVVILDSPPVLSVADAEILAAKVTGVILVVRSGKTRAQSARHASEILCRARARVLGVLLNAAPKSSPIPPYSLEADRSVAPPNYSFSEETRLIGK